MKTFGSLTDIVPKTYAQIWRDFPYQLVHLLRASNPGVVPGVVTIILCCSHIHVANSFTIDVVTYPYNK